MKKLIEQIDRVLARVKPDAGDSVMLLADARRALGELYQMAPDDAPAKEKAEQTEGDA